MQKNTYFTKTVSIFIILAFSLTSVQAPASAQASAFHLPPVGSMVALTQPTAPAVLKGLRINPDNPFQFDFLVDPGDLEVRGQRSEVRTMGGEVTSQKRTAYPVSLTSESTKLIKYFLASLTIPEDEMWVNLSPYEQERVIPTAFGETEMGRDLLAQDYLLKQITSSLMYPEDELGAKFWEKIHAQTGVKDIPVNMFNKVWIIPEEATVYEGNPSTGSGHGGVAYVVESRLKVMLEEDYMREVRDQRSEVRTSEGKVVLDQNTSNPLAHTSEILREIVIPVLEREVNEGSHFAPLRQIYHSLILASWYKTKLKNSVLTQVYANRKKIQGVVHGDKDAARKIYDQYIESFKVGVYDFIKEEYDPVTQSVIPRKYFSGGMGFAQNLRVETTRSPAMLAGDLAMTGLLEITTKFERPSDAASEAMNTSSPAMTRRNAVKLGLPIVLGLGLLGQAFLNNEKPFEYNGLHADFLPQAGEERELLEWFKKGEIYWSRLPKGDQISEQEKLELGKVMKVISERIDFEIHESQFDTIDRKGNKVYRQLNDLDYAWSHLDKLFRVRLDSQYLQDNRFELSRKIGRLEHIFHNEMQERRPDDDRLIQRSAGLPVWDLFYNTLRTMEKEVNSNIEQYPEEWKAAINRLLSFSQEPKRWDYILYTQVPEEKIEDFKNQVLAKLALSFKYFLPSYADEMLGKGKVLQKVEIALGSPNRDDLFGLIQGVMGPSNVYQQQSINSMADALAGHGGLYFGMKKGVPLDTLLHELGHLVQRLAGLDQRDKGLIKQAGRLSQDDYRELFNLGTPYGHPGTRAMKDSLKGYETEIFANLHMLLIDPSVGERFEVGAEWLKIAQERGWQGPPKWLRPGDASKAMTSSEASDAAMTLHEVAEGIKNEVKERKDIDDELEIYVLINLRKIYTAYSDDFNASDLEKKLEEELEEELEEDGTDNSYSYRKIKNDFHITGGRAKFDGMPGTREMMIFETILEALFIPVRADRQEFFGDVKNIMISNATSIDQVRNNIADGVEAFQIDSSLNDNKLNELLPLLKEAAKKQQIFIYAHSHHVAALNQVDWLLSYGEQQGGEKFLGRSMFLYLSDFGFIEDTGDSAMTSAPASRLPGEIVPGNTELALLAMTLGLVWVLNRHRLKNTVRQGKKPDDGSDSAMSSEQKLALNFGVIVVALAGNIARQVVTGPKSEGQSEDDKDPLVESVDESFSEIVDGFKEEYDVNRKRWEKEREKSYADALKEIRAEEAERKRGEKGETQQESNSSDSKDGASVDDPVGGIDLNPANWTLKMKGKHGGDCADETFDDCLRFNLPPAQIERMRLQIDGLVPVILNIQPVQSLPIFLGLNEEDIPFDAYLTDEPPSDTVEKYHHEKHARLEEVS